MSFATDPNRTKAQTTSNGPAAAKPARAFLPVLMPSLMQLAGATGLAADVLLKAQQVLLNLPGSSVIHSISKSMQIPSSWQIVSHLLSINGAKSTKDESFKGEQRARFNLKIASSRGAVQISARIVFRRRASFLASENSRALIQIVVRVVNETGIQEHLQDIFICGTGKLNVRNRSGEVEKRIAAKAPALLQAARETISSRPIMTGALVPVFNRSIVVCNAQ